ncbi:hypothetical protein GT994_07795 [Bifidobacterium longum]|uniref:Uncharacterized protein n=1 Tax=Bifidobacterium longum TaxID=216816 RepID=A0A6B1W765_BIFLN|nr:hypothetical protein GBL36_07405 [Bifidobacterium longum]KAB6721928.1 hypothetical protein GBL29_06140 [Bifidobacterium longum]KAB6722240.1 hypothetical protein GBL27_06245 [Bifidobacterium longum]KAB6726767.1 hypothetical protein GBL26_06110 [Bifidobacterium longum]KAB6727655.1 hypothetical protein GBL24_06365 [Bifidobacterium longum]
MILWKRPGPPLPKRINSFYIKRKSCLPLPNHWHCLPSTLRRVHAMSRFSSCYPILATRCLSPCFTFSDKTCMLSVIKLVCLR